MTATAHHEPARDRRRRGFTLIEIMVVIVILGLLMTIVVPNVVGSRERADQQAAKTNVAELYKIVQHFMLENRRIPNWDELITPDSTGNAYLEGYDGPPLDPWDNEYEIIPDPEYPRKAVVRSWGPDGTPDTDDDITSKNLRSRKDS